MRILQVCPRYYPAIGGVEEHVRNISERLARNNAVTVFACNPSGKLPRKEEVNHVLIRRFKSFSPSDAYYISFEMLKRLRKSDFDIVHGHSYHAFPLYFSRYAKRKKFVVTPHYHGRGHTPFRDFLIRLYKPLGKKIFEEADRVISVSNYEKELLIKHFGIIKDKIGVVRNGVNLAEFSHLESIPKEGKTILYVGRVEEYKGVQYIVQALPLLDNDFNLKIVGEGPYENKLVKLINNLRLNDRVKFYRHLPREELLKMYAKASVFALLSRYEAFALTIAEALAAKTPCVVANTSALAEWVDNKNCFGIDYPIDSNKLADLMSEVIIRKVTDVKLWDWDKVVSELTRVYEED